MASAVFQIEDTKAARKELSLLLQVEQSELDHVSHGGVLTIEFPNILEDKALHVLSTAVSNHGFNVSIKRQAPEASQKSSTASAPAQKKSQWSK